MATERAFGPSSSTSTLSVPPFTQSNHIDLTQDEDNPNDHYRTEHSAKRIRLDSFTSRWDDSSRPSIFVNQHDTQSRPLSRLPSFNHNLGMPTSDVPSTNSDTSQPAYRPAFASSSNFPFPCQSQASSPPSNSLHLPPPVTHSSSMPVPSHPQVIDLTHSPSPPPSVQQQHSSAPSLPLDLPPKTPVCIGQLSATALVLYPVPYLRQQDPSNESEWALVRLQYEHNPNKSPVSETVHIKAPSVRGPNGEPIPGEAFGVVEQKVAAAIGPMLGKGLIRVDAKVRKGPANVGFLDVSISSLI